jgi:hypothetical protein
MAHFWMVQHVVCTEHGDLVHASEAVGPVQPAVREIVDSQQADSVSASTEGSSAIDDNHDCCMALTERRKSSPVARTSWDVPPPPPARVALTTVEGASPLASQVPFLRLAPKTSPPTTFAPA